MNKVYDMNDEIMVLNPDVYYLNGMFNILLSLFLFLSNLDKTFDFQDDIMIML